MEKERTPMSENEIREYVEGLVKNKRLDADTAVLVQEDLVFGLTKEEVSEYIVYRRNFSMRQKTLYSQCLRAGMTKEIRSFLFGKDIKPEATEQLYKLYEEGLTLEQMREVYNICDGSANRMKETANKYMKKINAVTEKLEEKKEEMQPLKQEDVTYAKDILYLIHDAVNALLSDREHYVKMVEAVAALEQNGEKSESADKEDTEKSSSLEELTKEINRLNQAVSDQENTINEQQNKIDKSNSAVIRLRDEKDELLSEITRLKQERTKHLDELDALNRKVKNLELDIEEANHRIHKIKEEDRAMDDDKKRGTPYGAQDYEEHVRTKGGADVITEQPASAYGAKQQNNTFADRVIPVYYPVNIVDGGRVIDRTMVEVSQRKSNGFLGLFGKMCCKKKSRADIVRLVATGGLTPAQLVQIKNAIERGLTEGQLVELINNDVDPEKMKEIIEIAVLENSMP